MAERQKIPSNLRWKIYARDGFACRYCGGKPPDAVLHIDHVKAFSKGGTDDEANLVTACQLCNSSKGANEIPEPQPQLHKYAIALEDVEKVTAITSELSPAIGRMLDHAAKEAQHFEKKGHPVEVAMSLIIMSTIHTAAWVYFRLKDSSKTKRDFMAMCATAFDESKENQ